MKQIDATNMIQFINTVNDAIETLGDAAKLVKSGEVDWLDDEYREAMGRSLDQACRASRMLTSSALFHGLRPNYEIYQAFLALAVKFHPEAHCAEPLRLIKGGKS